MTDRMRIIDECERYWTATGVPAAAAAEMRQELDEHLRAAEVDGRDAQSVIGDDVAGFAESWAAERRSLAAPPAPHDDPVADDESFLRSMRGSMALAGIGLVAMVVALVLIPVDGGTDDNEAWRWVWTIGALVLSLAEIATAGFFLLPFGVGMAAAAVLAWLDVNLLSQWLAFFGGTALAFAVVQRFLRTQDLAPQPQVGANRWSGRIGVVLETVDRHENVGMVRIGGEEWRATTEGPPIGAGATVRVSGVRGTRLIVEPRLESE
ncbi:MAG: NfeD family protein [Acidimicrobiia bacterium]|nr:NfeD family protein [Acidimicrobiia bacterium]